MSSFWQLSDGKKAEQTAQYEVGSFDVIPDNTDALAIIEEAGWRSGFNGEPDLINLRWSILKPEALKNRKVFQKIKVNDERPENADRAKRMLMAIDTNAGGHLAKLDKEPEDSQLMGALMNKPMVIKIKVWEIDDKKGNWVAAVAPINGQQQAPAPQPAQTQAPSGGGMAMDDDIPFAPARWFI